MRKILIPVFALVVIITSCEKEEIKPSNPNPKENLRDCKKCDGNWETTDPDGEV